MVFARHVRAARKISTQFEERRVQKIYWTLVAGAVAPERGTWVDHLRKVYGHPQAEVVPADHPEAREAVLHYEVRGQGRSPSGEVISWLQVHLETGRTHCASKASRADLGGRALRITDSIRPRRRTTRTRDAPCAKPA
jgi:23S rRNA pseudouridine1911/1915/1917 synthase